jgi:hypothetical protein
MSSEKSTDDQGIQRNHTYADAQYDKKRRVTESVVVFIVVRVHFVIVYPEEK